MTTSTDSHSPSATLNQLDPRGMDSILDFTDSDQYHRDLLTTNELSDDDVDLKVHIIGHGVTTMAPPPATRVIYAYQDDLDGNKVCNVNDQSMELNGKIAIYADTLLDAERIRRDLVRAPFPNDFIIKSKLPLKLIDGFYPAWSLSRGVSWCGCCCCCCCSGGGGSNVRT